jgi:MFS family permease
VAFVVIGISPLFVLLTGGALAYGFGEGASIPTLQDYVAGTSPDRTRGLVVAVWVSAVRAGQTAGPILAAVTLAAIGTGATFVAGGLVAAMMVLAQFAIPLDTRVPHTEEWEFEL